MIRYETFFVCVHREMPSLSYLLVSFLVHTFNEYHPCVKYSRNERILKSEMNLSYTNYPLKYR